LDDNPTIDKYLENTQALQVWLNKSSIKIMTNLFRCSEKT